MADSMPPVVVKISADTSDLMAKLEAAEAVLDRLQAKQAALGGVGDLPASASPSGAA